MNFFSGKLLKEGDKLLFDEGSAKLPVPSWAAGQLGEYTGKEVVLGVRPEALADKTHARFETAGNVMNFKVTLVQPLGDKMDIYLSTEHHPHSVAHVDAFVGIKAGETLPMYIDLDRVHFFEPGETGKRIARNPGKDN
jgi:multiple sugar transport system ATP-binding protein